jgi:hypothetical protein
MGIGQLQHKATRPAAVVCAIVAVAAWTTQPARCEDTENSSREPPPASSPDLLVRPIFGVGFGTSASGGAFDVQLGLRVSPALLRLSLDVGGNGGRSFFLGAVHADWILWSGESLAGFLGLGLGRLQYGYLFDSPSYETSALLPEAGLVLGHRRGLGRFVLSISAVVPLNSPAPNPNPSDHIGPPGFIGSLIVSL